MYMYMTLHHVPMLHSLLQGAKVTLISSYTDKSGLFMSDPERDEEAPDTNELQAGQQKVTARSEAEEEDELLYGDIDALIGREKLAWLHSHPLQYIHTLKNLYMYVYVLVTTTYMYMYIHCIRYLTCYHRKSAMVRIRNTNMYTCTF